MAGGQQVEQRVNHQHERNRIHDDNSAAQPEQARAKEQGGNNQQDVAEQQSDLNGVCNQDQVTGASTFNMQCRAPSSSIPSSIPAQPLLGDAHRR